jgi:hypothetical protein
LPNTSLGLGETIGLVSTFIQEFYPSKFYEKSKSLSIRVRYRLVLV